MSDTATTIPTGFDAAIGALAAKVTETNADDFIVKVHRKASPAATPESVATLKGARVEHFREAEAWLMQLLGGGPIFSLSAYHTGNPNVLVAVVTVNVPGAPKSADPTVTARPGWLGPATITFPPLAQRQNGAVRALFDGDTNPGGSGRTDPAAQSGNAHPGAGASGAFDAIASARFELIEARQRDAAERLEKMIEASQKASQQSIDAMTRLVEKVLTKPVEAPKSEFTIEKVASIATAVGTILTPLLVKREESQSQERARLAELEAKREERERADRAEMTKMLQAANEKTANAAADMTKVVSPMIDAFSSLGRTIMQQTVQMRELTMPPEPEEGIGSMLKPLAGALGEFMAAQSEAKARAAQARQPRLPPPQPAPVAAAPQAPMAEPPAATVDDDSDEEETDASGIAAYPSDRLLGELEQAVRAHMDVQKLAEGYAEAYVHNAGVQAAIKAAGGTLAFFQARLGDWVTQPANMTYLTQLLPVLAAEGQKRGIANA